MRGIHVICVASTAGLMATMSVGCTGEQESLEGGEVRVPLLQMSPQEALTQTEQQLLGVDGQRVVFGVRSEGAFEGSLEGELTLGEGNALKLDASGVFGADSVALWLDATDTLMSWGNQGNESEQSRPAGLRDAVVVGFVRMGVLHNLARLVAGVPPDRMDGDVRSWVEVVDPEWVSGEAEVGQQGISFGIEVAGQRAGTATVWLTADGTMVARDQLVQFPTGEMTVRERYSWEVEAPRDR